MPKIYQKLNSQFPINSLLLADANMDNMPVAKLNNNDTRMCIVQTDVTAYNMSVAGTNLPQVHNMKGAALLNIPEIGALTNSIKKLNLKLPENALLFANANIDHMPVARLSNTDPKMRIVQTDITVYTMPIADMNLPQVYNMNKIDVIELPPR